MIISLIHSFDPSIYYAIFVQSIRRAEIIIFDHDEIKFFKKYYYIYNVELKKKGDKVKKKGERRKRRKRGRNTKIEDRTRVHLCSSNESRYSHTGPFWPAVGNSYVSRESLRLSAISDLFYFFLKRNRHFSTCTPTKINFFFNDIFHES